MQYMSSNLFQLNDQEFQNPFMIENDNLIEDNLVSHWFEGEFILYDWL